MANRSTQSKTNKAKQNSKSKKADKKINPWLIVLIVCGVLAAIIVLALIVVNLANSDPEPPVAADDSWERVQKSGVLRVATAADYPPFSYFNADHVIDGFDPALIREIGAELGLQVEIADYAFDGLGATLKVGQADVVIAAISVTSERDALVDFSNIYYVGQDGILARSDSEIDAITNVQQMAGKRVGVQRSSVYETWAQKTLVDGGIIAQDQLFVYAEPQHAVDDLKLNRLDLVVMDLQPATAALSQGDLRLVGQGLNQQRYAMAVVQGANSLVAEINRVLLTLQNDGTVNRLIGTYLGLRPEDVIPPPTPAPTPEACIDAMEFIDNLNLDDQNLTSFPQVDPGQAFQKGWRIRNSGSCTWNSAYFARFVSGNTPAAQMQGQPTAIQGEVRPGQTYDLYVNLVAPEAAGRYVGYWQMHNAANQAFGQTIWVAVEVPGPEAVAPTATLTAAATATPTLLPTATATPPPPPTATPVPPQPTATSVPPTAVPTEKPGSDLREFTWILVGYLMDIDDPDLTQPIPNTRIDLAFDDEDLYSGNAGCNTYQGRYVTDGKKIILTAGGSTQLMCAEPAGTMEQEASYLRLLTQVEEYRINENGQLEMIRYINDANNQRVEKILLVFDGLKASPR